MLEILAELLKTLAVKVGAVITGFFVSAVMAIPNLPSNVQTSVAGISTSVPIQAEASCTVTVNGETKTYTYTSDSGSQTVVCGSQNGQSFSSNVDTGEMTKNINQGLQDLKSTLKSLFPNIGL